MKNIFGEKYLIISRCRKCGNLHLERTHIQDGELIDTCLTCKYKRHYIDSNYHYDKLTLREKIYYKFRNLFIDY